MTPSPYPQLEAFLAELADKHAHSYVNGIRQLVDDQGGDDEERVARAKRLYTYFEVIYDAAESSGVIAPGGRP